ncbi:MAG: hypothetical protein K8T10_09395 [Candidatus Eremiobacteraeota bacterium]|nr:hypothetical protein [Candidatus Eremiobacteraeota bacterium]
MNKYHKIILIIYLLAFCILIALTTYGLFQGFDVWFHMKNGEFIVKNRYIPHKDPFLYTTKMLPSYYFTNYEWLFGIIVYEIFTNFDYAGINAFRTIIIFSIFAFVLLTCIRREPRFLKSSTLPFVAIAFTFIAFLTAFPRFEPRPQIISGLCLALFSFLLIQKLNWKYYIGFFFISLFWSNCHVEILLGIALVFISMIQKTIEYLVSGNDEEKTVLKKSALQRLYILLITTAALLISPPARGMLSQAANYYSRKIHAFRIIELMPIDIKKHLLHGPFGILLVSGILFFIIASVIDRKRLPDLLLFIPFAATPFISRRFLLPSAVILAPVIVTNIECVLSYMREKKMRIFPPVKYASIALFPILLIFMSKPYLGLQRTPPSIPSKAKQGITLYNPDSLLPDAALRFLNRERVEGHIFCPYQWGNFIVFYENPYEYASKEIENPQDKVDKGKTGGRIIRKPFIDGMLQTYHRRILDDYMAIMTDDTRRDKLIEKYDVDVFLLSYPPDPNDPFFSLGNYLYSSDKWKLVYWDDLSIVFIKEDKLKEYPGIASFDNINPALFNAQGNAVFSLPSPGKTLAELQKSLERKPGGYVVKTYQWMGILQYITGDVKSAIATMEKGLMIKPDSSVILFNLAIIYLRMGEKEKSRAYLEKSLKSDPYFIPALELKKSLDK